MTEEIAARVALACRVLGKLGLTHGAEGHVSMRLGEAAMAIRGKGRNQVGVAFTSADDVLEVDFDARVVGVAADGLRPPSETYLHSAIYQERAEVMSVIHMHPEDALVLTGCRKPLVPFHGRIGQGARLAAQGVPLFETARKVDTVEAGKALTSCLGAKQAALMLGHGIVTVGRTVEEAAVTALELNELLRLTARAYAVGEPVPLPPDEVRDLAAPRTEPKRLGAPSGAEGTAAAWRYYCAVAGEE